MTDGTEQGGFSQGRFGNNGGMRPNGGQQPDDFSDDDRPEPPQGSNGDAMPQPPIDGQNPIS